MANKLALLLISWVFGGLGVDRFYLAVCSRHNAIHIIIGLIKLCTGGGFGLLSLFDFIVILAESLFKTPGTMLDKSIVFTHVGSANILSKVIIGILVVLLLLIVVVVMNIISIAMSISNGTTITPHEPGKMYKAAMYISRKKTG